ALVSHGVILGSIFEFVFTSSERPVRLRANARADGPARHPIPERPSPSRTGAARMHIPSLSFDLGEEIDLLRESVAQFASAHIAPLAAEADAGNHFPNQLWRQLGEQGLLGMTVEEQYGGSGMGYLAHVVAMEEIS